MTKRSFFLYFLVNLYGILWSQPTNSYLNDVVLAPPSSSSIGKFVDIPVNAHTGVPKIGVPIYTLQEGPLQLAISLNYHASGIKLQELSSWIGLGWALNAGGIVSRTILGLADEDITGGYWHTGSTLTDDNQGAVNVGESVKDGEPDLFSFSFPGYGGKFILDKNHQPVLIPDQDISLSVDFDVTTNKFIRFTFIDPEGKKFIFGSPEGLNNRSGVDSIKATSGFVNKFLPYQDQAWNLMEIKTSDNKYKISFEYHSDTYSYRSSASYNLDIVNCTSQVGAGSSEASGSGGLLHTLSDGRQYYTMINTFSGRRLRRINRACLISHDLLAFG